MYTDVAPLELLPTCTWGSTAVQTVFSEYPDIASVDGSNTSICEISAVKEPARGAEPSKITLETVSDAYAPLDEKILNSATAARLAKYNSPTGLKLSAIGPGISYTLDTIGIAEKSKPAEP